jgi:hypothetical protein
VPGEYKKGRRDPYTSQFIVNLANRWVVKLLDGVTQAVGAETLLRNNLETIWDDRTLRRAFQLFNGVPQLNFIEANSGVNAYVKRRLDAMTTIPGKA